MKKINLSQIMKLAWTFFKTTGQDFSKCLSQAWANFKLVAKMQTTIVKFYFQKVDGTTREAWGTLKGVEDKVKGDNRSNNPTVQVYFDTEKQEFRCFKKLNLIG